MRSVMLALAWRQMTILRKNPSLFLPPMLFPLINFTAFAGGLSRLRHVPGFEFKGGYTSFVFVFVLLQSAAFGGVFTGFGIARDFERGFARRLMIASKHRSGIVWGYALASLLRWSLVAITAHDRRADRAHAGRRERRRPLRPLHARAHRERQRASLGVRDRDALPLGAGRAADADADLHPAVPLAGVRAARRCSRAGSTRVARLNPLTYILTSGRGFISGEPTDVALAFTIAFALLGCLGIWGLRGLKRAEQVV